MTTSQLFRGASSHCTTSEQVEVIGEIVLMTYGDGTKVAFYPTGISGSGLYEAHSAGRPKMIVSVTDHRLFWDMEKAYGLW